MDTGVRSFFMIIGIGWTIDIKQLIVTAREACNANNTDYKLEYCDQLSFYEWNSFDDLYVQSIGFDVDFNRTLKACVTAEQDGKKSNSSSTIKLRDLYPGMEDLILHGDLLIVAPSIVAVNAAKKGGAQRKK